MICKVGDLLLVQKSTEQLTRCSTGTLAEEIAVNNTVNKTASRTISEKIMSVCRKAIRWTVLLDVFLMLSGTVLLAILEFGTFPYNQMGFFCNDPKISFKFMGDTISMGLLLSSTIILPLLVIWPTEYACYSADSYEIRMDRGSSRTKLIWSWYGHYTAGSVTLGALCEFMKVLIGEPRPHFLDTCRPREATNCTDEYVSSYTCTNTDYSTWFISDSSKSFPSGHAALSVFTSIFIVWYLQNRLPSRTLFLKPWLQCLMCMWAVTCSLSRIGDNRHHWWDVLVGVGLGLLFGLFIVVVSCRHFRVERPTKSVVTHTINEQVENGQIDFADK